MTQRCLMRISSSHLAAELVASAAELLLERDDETLDFRIPGARDPGPEQLLERPEGVVMTGHDGIIREPLFVIQESSRNTSRC